jgi:hypothetical protein
MRARLSRRLAFARKLARMERARNRGRPRLSALAGGFFSDKLWLYPFDSYPRALFLTDWEIEARLPGVNDPQAERQLGDKRAFHAMRERFPLPVPDLIGVWFDGVCAEAIAEWPGGEEAIAKPVRGHGGRGIERVTRPRMPELAGSYLVERLVPAHPYASRIFPGALNTVRVLVGRAGTGGAVVLGAVHRFGTQASGATDNFSAGGIVSAIEPASGRLSGAIARSASGERRVLDGHPETGARIAGVEVPFWSEIRDAAAACTEAVDGLHYVGWDIAVSPSGPVLIEGNAALPNPNILQMHRPLLAHPEAQALFHGLGVLSDRRLAQAQRASGKMR